MGCKILCLIFFLAMITWFHFLDYGWAKLKADHDQWRRKADKATAMAEWLADVVGADACPEPYERMRNCKHWERPCDTFPPPKPCQQCWLKAADEAVKEKPEC